MVNIKPLNESEVPESSGKIYADIRSTLNVNAVPMFFKYLSNSPELLEYTWKVVYPALNDVNFKAASKKMEELAADMMKMIYAPSAETLTYSNYISDQEKAILLQSVSELNKVNSTLLLVTIALRESLKGLGIKDADFLLEHGQSLSDSLLKTLDNISGGAELEKLSNSLSTIVKYPDFYDLIAKDMSRLMQTEKYLKVRVEFEKIAQMLIEQMPVRINLTYAETMNILVKSSSARDLIYLIYDVFPSQSPHNLLTSSGMELALKPNLSIEIAS